MLPAEDPNSPNTHKIVANQNGTGGEIDEPLYAQNWREGILVGMRPQGLRVGGGAPEPLYSWYGKANNMAMEAGSICTHIRKFCRFLPSSTDGIAPPPASIARNNPCAISATTRSKMLTQIRRNCRFLLSNAGGVEHPPANIAGEQPLPALQNGTAPATSPQSLQLCTGNFSIATAAAHGNSLCIFKNYCDSANAPETLESHLQPQPVQVPV